MRTFTVSEKEFIGTSALVALSLLFFAFFEGTGALSPVLQGGVIGLVFFHVMPLSYCRFVLKRPLGDLGFRKSFGARPFLTALVTVLAFLILEYVLYRSLPRFGAEYVLPVLVRQNFLWFVLYELFMVTLVVLVYETFFRGLIQMLWLRGLGPWAILLQALFFYGLFFLSTGFSYNALPLLLFAPAAGFVASRTRSLWYSAFASWLFFFLTDVLLLALR
jgi:hypothetical protein